MPADNKYLLPLLLGGVALGGIALGMGGGKIVSDNIKAFLDQDVTAKAANAKYSSTGNNKRYKTRKIEKIDTICLHQTGIHNFSDKAWWKATCHIGVSQFTGEVYYVHPIGINLAAANGWNTRAISIEVGGNFRGYVDKESSFWKQGGGPTEFTDKIKNGLQKAIKLAMALAKVSGTEIKYIVAHRQSHSSRAVDPGEAIWRAGGVWAQKQYGLRTLASIGSGIPLPAEWGEPASGGLADAGNLEGVVEGVGTELPPEEEFVANATVDGQRLSVSEIVSKLRSTLASHNERFIRTGNLSTSIQRFNLEELLSFDNGRDIFGENP